MLTGLKEREPFSLDASSSPPPGAFRGAERLRHCLPAPPASAANRRALLYVDTTGRLLFSCHRRSAGDAMRQLAAMRF